MIPNTQQMVIDHVAEENDIGAVQLDATYEFRRTLRFSIFMTLKLILLTLFILCIYIGLLKRFILFLN